jgi:hypothetical protein
MTGAARSLILSLLLVPGLAVEAHPQENPAQRIFELTNQDRLQLGLPALRWDAALARAAEAHAARMAERRTITHQFPGEPELMERASAAGAHFQAVAENVAVGPSPGSIDNGWMHSPGHRANILDPKSNALGVGVVERDGYLYAVEDFDESSEQLTYGQVEARVRELLRQQGVDATAPAAAAEEACRMQGGFPGGARVRSIVRFETADLSHLPSEVMQQLRGGDRGRAAVGACAPDPGQASFTRYRVAVLFY